MPQMDERDIVCTRPSGGYGDPEVPLIQRRHMIRALRVLQRPKEVLHTFVICVCQYENSFKSLFVRAPVSCCVSILSTD